MKLDAYQYHMRLCASTHLSDCSHYFPDPITRLLDATLLNVTIARTLGMERFPKLGASPS